MNFFRKVYYSDKAIVLTESKEAYVAHNPAAKSFISVKGASDDHFSEALQLLERPGVNGIIIEDVSEAILMHQLHSMYRIIDAGGGVTYNEKGEILMIFRRGKWDLPKGKLDEGEQIEECALREVSEETGLENIELSDKIVDTYHIYQQKDEYLLKRTAWYKMHGSSAQKLKPQQAENILEARWVSLYELPPLAAKSYEAIREVLTAAGLKW